MDKIKRGWHVAMRGWEFIWENPSCLIFPLISAVTKAALFLTIMGMYGMYALKRIITYKQAHPHATDAMMKMHLKPNISPVTGTLLTLAFTFVGILIASIMYTALSYYMAKKLEGTPVSLGTSFMRSLSRFKTLCVWSLINAVLTMIFNIIRNAAKDGKFPLNLIARLVAGLLQFAWEFLTFFVIPIFALKDLGAIASIEASGSTVKKMWGEQIGATFNIGLIGFVSFLILGLLTWGPLYLTAGAPSLNHHPKLFFFYLVGIVIAGIIVSLWLSTATTLFKTAAYLHSQGKSSGPFQAEFIKTSFQTKPSKS